MSEAFRCYRIAVLALVLLTALASICRSFGFFIHKIYWAQEYLGGDKAVHVYIGILLLHAVTIWLNPHVKPRYTVVSLVIVQLFFLAEEALQQLSPTRTFDWGDIIATMCGLLIIGVWNSVFSWLKPLAHE